MPTWASFRAAFGGAPEAGRAGDAQASRPPRRHTGDQLYRVPVPGFTGANRMETDLDLGGNDLTGANAVEADTLALESDLTVGGGLTVTADLMVGRALNVSGSAEVAAGVTAAERAGGGRGIAGLACGHTRSEGGEPDGAGRREGGLGRGERHGGSRECLPCEPAERQRDGEGGDGNGGLRCRRHGAGGAGHGAHRRRGGGLQPSHRRTLHGVLRGQVR